MNMKTFACALLLESLNLCASVLRKRDVCVYKDVQYKNIYRNNDVDLNCFHVCP